MTSRQFASDNHAPILPEVISHLTQTNTAHAPAYADDPTTELAKQTILNFLGRAANSTDQVHFVPTGTAANTLCLATLSDPWDAVICHEFSHLYTDECAAPEHLAHIKLLPTSGSDAKINLEHAHTHLQRAHGIHATQSKIISITLPTELGTLYSIPELETIRQLADAHSLLVHLDGARFFNAIAALEIEPPALIKILQPDAISLGGTKAGALATEAAVFLDFGRHNYLNHNPLKPEYLRKQAGHLISKSRYLAAQWLGLLENKAALRAAHHANHMAGLLESQLTNHNITILRPRQANAVFIELWPDEAQALFDQGWLFYDFLEPRQYRLMTSWDTEQSDIDRFITDLKTATKHRLGG
ncbi:Low specificity L-threonine aldolase [Poriferisphaera corsica]|uniref:Low specificity L-threonine aldolase n=1 Tax=Poriferisphaera corsica TaxID=2528020 RepID=A0A517YZ93_9BACT|nr:aminotransferase class I/II-fold pyridoxal phosphate-dependent enzyme [Poriferisphaera corsica]QDU35552.1 Low specificity L-threonine aldolase [Poriferisphaera corsica]